MSTTSLTVGEGGAFTETIIYHQCVSADKG